MPARGWRRGSGWASWLRRKTCWRAYGRRSDPDAAAQALFDVLRALDAERPDVILAADVGQAAIGAAIRDRLMRAAEGRVIAVPEVSRGAS